MMQTQEQKRTYATAYNHKPEVMQHRKEYRQRPEVKKRNKEYRTSHHAELLKRSRSPERKAYIKTYNQLPKMKAYFKKYNALPEVLEHKRERVRVWESMRYQNDPQWLLSKRLRTELRYNFNYYLNMKKTKTASEYGIDWEACIKKLLPLPFPIEERNNWHIDHIIPVSAFDLTNPEEIRKCFSPENLQWLPAHENIIKRNKILVNQNAI